MYLGVRFGNFSPKDFDFLRWLLNSLLVCSVDSLLSNSLLYRFSVLLCSLTSLGACVACSGSLTWRDHVHRVSRNCFLQVAVMFGICRREMSDVLWIITSCSFSWSRNLWNWPWLHSCPLQFIITWWPLGSMLRSPSLCLLSWDGGSQDSQLDNTKQTLKLIDQNVAQRVETCTTGIDVHSGRPARARARQGPPFTGPCLARPYGSPCRAGLAHGLGWQTRHGERPLFDFGNWVTI